MQLKKYVDRVKKRASRSSAIPRPAAKDFSIGVPFEYQPSPDSLSFRIAGICHMYFTDLAPEMLTEFEQIPYLCDLYISTDSDEKRSLIQQVFSHWEKGLVEIRVAENRGRDIAHKVVTFRDVYSNYDLLIFTHSKKSYTAYGSRWRKFLVSNLIGSPLIVSSIVDLFAKFPSVGMIISQHYEPIRELGMLGWGDNYRHAKRLAQEMGIKIGSRVLDFPSGSMFWARPAALKPLLELNLSLKDFPAEEGQIDGTIAHAIERLFLHCCERAGFIWLKVANPLMFKNRGTIEQIKDPSDVSGFIQKHILHLT